MLLETVRKVWYSFQPRSLLSGASLFNISPPPLPPILDFARCDYASDQGQKVCPGIFRGRWNSFMGASKWAKFAQYVAPRTCLHTLVFLHFPCFPFARRSMTCLPRFSAVSLWEEATSRRFVSGWGEPFVVALCILRRSELCWTFCECLSKDGMLWQEGGQESQLAWSIKKRWVLPNLTAVFMTAHSCCEFLHSCRWRWCKVFKLSGPLLIPTQKVQL